MASMMSEPCTTLMLVFAVDQQFVVDPELIRFVEWEPDDLGARGEKNSAWELWRRGRRREEESEREGKKWGLEKCIMFPIDNRFSYIPYIYRVVILGLNCNYGKFLILEWNYESQNIWSWAKWANFRLGLGSWENAYRVGWAFLRTRIRQLSFTPLVVEELLKGSRASFLFLGFSLSLPLRRPCSLPPSLRCPCFPPHCWLLKTET